MTDLNQTAACLLVQEEAPQPSPAPTRVCVIDLGTNSFHAIIVEAYPNRSFEVLDKLKEMVYIGEGGVTDQQLSEEKMACAVEALQRIKLLAEGYGVEDYLAYATSAIREAENGGALIERVRREVGLRIRPISGELEARLIYKGVRRAVDLTAPTLLVDIGGGSTECIIGTAEEVFYQASFKVGAARMTQRFITTDPVEAGEFKALRAHYRAVLAPVFEAARRHGVQEIVGSSGTVENLAQVYLDEHGEEDRTIFQATFDAKDFRRITKKIMRSSRAEREEMSGIDAKRVDQIVAGAVLVDVFLKDLEIERLRISPNALREGMVEHYIEQHNRRIEQLAPFADVRLRSVHELAFQCGWDAVHARHVAAVALQLFDACRALHGLGHDERELLRYAALLHDIGYHISRRAHHKHTLYLIQHADLHGFQPEEIALLANVARYHRRSRPKKKHDAYTRLPKEQRRRVDQLASLLRLAEGLDRSKYQNVTHLATRLDDEALHITIQTAGDPQLELWGARHSADLFEKTFGRKVIVTAAALG